MEATTEPLVFGAGREAGAYTRPLNGLMDEIRIWSDVRTQQEIIDNMRTSVATNAGNLVGYWKLDESSGFTAADSQTNTTTRNGTLANGATFNGVAGSTEKWWRFYDGMDVQRFSNSTTPAAENVVWTFSGV
jgi:hypothetical protein